MAFVSIKYSNGVCASFDSKRSRRSDKSQKKDNRLSGFQKNGWLQICFAFGLDLGLLSNIDSIKSEASGVTFSNDCVDGQFFIMFASRSYHSPIQRNNKNCEYEQHREGNFIYKFTYQMGVTRVILYSKRCIQARKYLQIDLFFHLLRHLWEKLPT